MCIKYGWPKLSRTICCVCQRTVTCCCVLCLLTFILCAVRYSIRLSSEKERVKCEVPAARVDPAALRVTLRRGAFKE